VLPFRSVIAVTAVACLGGLPAAAHAQLNVVCSAPAEWCKVLAEEFAKDTGVKAALLVSGARAALAMLAEHRSKPQSDVWFGGSAETHVRATKFGIVDEYASPMVTQLQPWAQKLAEQSKSTSIGVYARVLGIGYNSALATQKKIAPPACWKDLIKPGFAGDVHMTNPNASVATYFAIAGMTQLFGEDEAFKYLKAMYKAPPPAAQRGRGGADAKAAAPKGVFAGGAGAGKAGAGKAAGDPGSARAGGGGKAAAGDASVAKAPPPVGSAIAGIGFVGDIVAEAESGAPVKAVAPCEGTIYEVGAVSIVKGARNLDNAKKFVDWVLGPKAQALAAKAKQYVYPANTAVAASPLAPKFGEIKLVTYDAAKYEKSAARRNLLDRWTQEVGTAAP
jgi:iron(III) transport system substrate-binding protein